MKKISILFFATLLMTTTYAQKSIAESSAGTIAPTTEVEGKPWKTGGGIGLFANQVALVNWAAGGVSSISGVVKGELFANYRQGKHSWENSLKGEWGMIKEEFADLKKNEDVLNFDSKYGFQLDKNGKLFAGALLSFNSQFTPGYKIGEKNYSTNFLAPANLIIAAGVDWKPSKLFSLFFSPIAGKLVIVTDKGVDETTYGLDEGSQMAFELGAYMKAELKHELMKNVNFSTALVLYTNYLDKNIGNIDVDWTAGLDLKVNEWITVKLGTQLIYDHDIKINLYDKDDRTVALLNADGTQKTGPRTQFKEALNIGFSYKFAPKEKK